MKVYAMEPLLNYPEFRPMNLSEIDPAIGDAVARLEQYILRHNYRGYDPYDGLMSPLFKLPLLRSSHRIRFLAQQAVKRFPVNLRPLLRIQPGYNPVTLGLCLQAFAYLAKVYPEREQLYLGKVRSLLSELKRLISPNFSGACWGYDFDWASRYANIPAFTPTVVATGIITNALFEYYRLYADEEAFKLCGSAANFVLKDLNRIKEGDHFCFSYSPFDENIVFNATMKGARLLSQVYSVTGDESLRETAQRTVAFVMKYQREDGAWIYSRGDARDWVDNYHTGYILEGLHEYLAACRDESVRNIYQKGLDYYLHNFIDEGGIPKFYDRSRYPVDCTAAAQTMVTLGKANILKEAEQVALWMIGNMQDRAGYFYFRRKKYRTIHISFMRWSNAWMLMAMAFFMFRKGNMS